MGEVRRVA
ncbi:hypothetical protein G443_001622 [Actinoalloteichus cyanogriseus DSM 43889]|uniref:Uncharacterized protein n=1 Tax=Actinoalloteichus caeruleus DSM 43889 TaxID=1120930 RepID=A0ABT1JFS7_ACTCY|nr:hypothetical protein [Actinoalloteichus caeruleus DSM 43889]